MHITHRHATEWMLTAALGAVLVSTAACGSGGSAPGGATSAAPPVRVYVTNEASGDISVIDPATQSVIATVKVGKRPRGLKVSPDGTMLYVALSGSPNA